MTKPNKQKKQDCLFILSTGDQYNFEIASFQFDAYKEQYHRVCVAVPTEVWLKKKSISWVIENYKVRYENFRKIIAIDKIYVFDTDYQLDQYKEQENPDTFVDIIQFIHT